MATCDTPCYVIEMACSLSDDVTIKAGLTAGTDYRVKIEDAFGNKAVTSPLTATIDGDIVLPLISIGSWVDLGAEITITILAETTNEVQEMMLGEDYNFYPCALLKFETHGAAIIA